jgi:hypothetical protein
MSKHHTRRVLLLDTFKLYSMNAPPWILDQSGRIWRLLRDNRLDFHVYDVDDSEPIIQLSGTQTPIVGVTVDGELYDLEHAQLLDIFQDSSDNTTSLSNHHARKSNFRAASMCCTPLEDRYIFAVTTNDNLYSFRYHGGRIRNWKLEMSDVDVMIPSLGDAYGIAVCTNDGEWQYISTYSEDEPIPHNIGRIQGVTPTLTPTTYIRDGIIVTDNVIFIIVNYAEEPIFEVILKNHGSKMVGLDSIDDPFIVSINEYNSRISITTQSVGFNDEESKWNLVLEDIDFKSGIKEFVRVKQVDYLLCNDGLLYHINKDGSIINSQIPPYIFPDLRLRNRKRANH